MKDDAALSPAVSVQRRAGGELILSCPYEPGNPPQSMVHLLLERAAMFPERTLIAEKIDGEWQHLTYGNAVQGCLKVANWLLDQGASDQRPLAILSRSSINHFLMAWGAIFARVPYVPVSTSYSTVTGAFPKLDAVLQKVNPAFLFAENFHLHQQALSAIDFPSTQATLICCEAPTGVQHTPFSNLQSHAGTKARAAITNCDHNTVARYMFTSGSTGMPKGVIVTHGMSCHMLASGAGLRDTPDPSIPTRVLDWMPWSHVGAGVMRIASMINAAGSIFLDTGKPVPGEFDKTLQNIREVEPTSFAGAPLGWSMLVDALEKDSSLAQSFYRHLRTMQSGSAAMPDSLALRIAALNLKYSGKTFQFGTSLLSTEVHVGLNRYWTGAGNNVVGLPAPGAELKLVPFGDKYELRVRSAGVTPGYLKDPEKTTASFDDEGFFKMGDALRFADPDRPEAGLCFAGRVAEEFKLITGTWVSAGTLRAEWVAAASPLVRDVVVCGINEQYLAALIWPNLARCAELIGTDDPQEIVNSGFVQQKIAEGLANHNRLNTGSSKAIRRFLLLQEPPDPGKHEITDKGYVNQAAAQQNRRHEIERLFAQAADDNIVVIET